MSDAYTDDEAALSASALGLLNSWPELRTQLAEIYTQRVAQLAFVPHDWLQGALDHLYEPSGAVWLPSPRPTNPPAWLDTPEKLDAWRQLFDAIEAAVGLYAKGQAEAGAAELARLQATASFWDGLYVAVKFVADAPGNVLAAAGTVADSIVGGIFSSGVGKLLLIGGVIAAGVAVYVLFPAVRKVAVGKVMALA